MIFSRLFREVEAKKQLYITLQQQYELARIEEVKETPSVVILDEAKPGVEKDSPKRVRIVTIFMLLGGVFAMGLSILKYSFKY